MSEPTSLPITVETTPVVKVDPNKSYSIWHNKLGEAKDNLHIRRICRELEKSPELDPLEKVWLLSYALGCMNL